MRLFRIIALATFTAIITTPAAADKYPSKNIKIIVSTSAGGITDLGARLIGAHMQAMTGETVVIDNRAGGGGNIALEACAKSPPDGYTLCFANTGNVVINPFLHKQLSYSPLTDLAPVAPLGTVPLFIVVNGNLPVKTLQDFIAYAKREKASYGSAGAGTTPHLAADDFARRARLDIVHVPYRGSTPATMAVLAGDVPMTFVSIGQHQGLVQQGKLKVLAIADTKRASYLPDVPTFEEQGFPGFLAGTWFALFAPAGTPQAIIDQINGHVRDFVQSPAAKKHFDTSFLAPMVMTAAEFGALVQADAAKWKKIVEESGIKQR